MRYGVVFPQTEIGADAAAIRDFAQSAENLGYNHILAYDHVIGANPASRPEWRGPYTHLDMFHEPFVLFGFLAGITRHIEFTTGILILPQRQTVLVAKQAAELDILSGGRLRLGVGTGWNRVEYEALGEDFTNRGRRSEEQIELMRRLWTEASVTFDGRWHRVSDAGVNPLPVQRPIPVWLGGTDDRVLKRLARIGDGWFPQYGPDDKCRAALDKLRAYAAAAGREPDILGIEGRLSLGRRPPEEWIDEVRAWKTLGATHLTVNTMKAGFGSPADHIAGIQRFLEAAAAA